MRIRLINAKRLWLIACLLMLSNALKAQVMWSLRGGIMPNSVHERIFDDEDYTVHKINWMAELGLEIPLSKTWNIETGLRYKMRNFVAYKDEHIEERYWNDDYTDTYVANERDIRHYRPYLDASFIELPVRATYKLHLNDNFALHLGCGPYASFNLEGKPFDYGQDFKSSALSVGIEPSAALYYKNLSVGVVYNNPVFFQRHKDMDCNRFMVTVGFRFGNKVWNAIGRGLDTFVESGAAEALGNAFQNAANAFGGNAEMPTDNYYSTPTETPSTPSGSSATNQGNKYNMSDQHNYNTDKQTYARYDSMLSAHFYGSRSATGNEVKQWQQAMKGLREKWTAQGKSFPHSSNEGHSTANCQNNQSHSH